LKGFPLESGKGFHGNIPMLSAVTTSECFAMSEGRIIALISRFRRDTRANIAVIFALATVPLITAVGCATDYSMAVRVRSKLQSAADTASLASISQKGAGYTAATLMTSNGSVPAGVTEANDIFNGNASTFAGYQNLSVNSTVTKTGATLASTVTFSADVPVTFMKIAGWSTMHITGQSKSSSSLPLYLDFYLMLDVSGSMGLPSTPAEAVRMQNINPDNYVQYPTGCTLACHFAPQNSACTNSGTQRYNTNNYCMGYIYSRVSQSALSSLINAPSTGSRPKSTVPGLPNAMITNLNNAVDGSPNSFLTGNANSLTYSLTAVSSCPTDGTDSCIQLRLDAVGYAVNQLFAYANQKAVIPNQFRIGLYPFIQFLYSYFPLTSSINGSTTNSSTINYAAANLATLLDTNKNTNLGSGGTHIDTAINSMNTLITSVGSGAASNNTLPYVFLVTDGAQDPQTKGVPNGSWAGSNHATTIDPTICTTMKSRGIKISVLYTPYVPINPVNTSFAGNEDTYANNNIPNIPASLQGCASPADSAGSYFYTANTPQDIQNALQAMFNHALTVAHITN
jgi:Flp pilus assembly protein TadG